MHRSARELWLALFAIGFITLAYLFMVAVRGGIPAAGDFYGHTLGVFGFLLMLMTETLYSLRKRSRKARWGRMASWLQFHIFTGLVGPYMVLLHSSWKFNGAAGVLMLMTVVIVLSGFVGRYIYTAVPRTADGIEIETEELQQQISATAALLQSWFTTRPELAPMMARLLGGTGASSLGSTLVLGRSRFGWQDRLSWWFTSQRMEPEVRREGRQLIALLRRQRLLRRQMASLAAARRMLAIWHTIHIPIGLGLFSLAFVHIGAALYYSILLY